MSVSSNANASRFQFRASGLEPSTLQVVDFTGTEAISTPFRYRFSLVAERDEIDEAMVGRPATFTVERRGQALPVRGIITHWERCGRSADHVWYEAVLRPRLWQLSLSTQSRVFQDASVPEIVAEVLEDHGCAAGDFQMAVTETYPLREYCVQYQETDLQFVRRLLEFEGISFFFRHEPDGDVLVVTDDRVRHPPIPAPDSLQFAEGAGMHRDRPEHVAAFTCRERLAPGRVVLDDTDARQPETDLQVDGRIAGEADGEMHEQGAKYRDVEQGRRLARVRAEEQAARRTVYRGRSDCPALHAGYRFALDGHDRAAFNQTYLVVETVHAGSQRKALGLRGVHPPGRPSGSMDAPFGLPGRERAEGEKETREEREEDTVYHNRFRCLPAQIPFRPERTTPVPRIPGLLTARVETTGGPYASLDADGWYRARMAFDRSERAPGQATKPIRMVTPSSGPDYGLHFPNHAGTEMIVAFLHGDVDRPLALGTVPNRTQKSPVTASNRMQNVLRTFGGSELRMDDTIGAEQILLQSPAGRKLRFDDDRERIHLETPSGHRLRLDDRRNRVAATTAAGHRLYLDDDEKTTGVRSAAGHQIQIDDATDRIVVQDTEGRHAITIDVAGNALRIETTGVLSLSAKDAVEITGRTVRIESAEQVEVEAGTHLSQQAGQDVAVEARGAVSVEAAQDLSLDAGTGASVSAREIELDAQQAVSARGGTSVQLRGNEVTIHGQSIADIRAALLKLNG